MAVVLREPADAGSHHFLSRAIAVPADGEPREAQVIAVPELRVGQGQAKEACRKSSSGGKAEILQKKN
ncbi:MAG TPA: hypothetical protein VIO80_07030 [Candidatus Dormibacteraeota bacterium]